jgi:hypothetical protein
MITAYNIIEALARFEDPVESAKKLCSLLRSLGATQGMFPDSNKFLYLKKLVPNALYTGQGYRFIGLDHRHALKEGIYDKIEDAWHQKSPNLPKLLSYFREYRGGRYQSWAKSLDGINKEMGKQEFYELTNGRGNFYIFTGQISGMDLEEVATTLRDNVEKLTISDKEKRDSFYGINDFIDDYGTSEEVLAPMPGKIDLYGVFSADDLKYVRDVRKVRVLGTSVDDVDLSSELRSAIKLGDIAKVNELIELGAELDDNILQQALEGGAEYDMFRELVFVHNMTSGDCGNGNTPLMIAVQNIDEELMKHLFQVSYQLNIDETNDDGETALWLAVDHRFHDGIKFLLRKKADPNKPAKDGTTPLTIAVKDEDELIIKMLLDGGANPNVQLEDGETPLTLFVEKRDELMVKVLLNAKAELDVRTDRGKTPLSLSIDNEDIQMTKLLLDAGADPNFNPSGETLLDLARAWEATETEDLLKRYGAKE